MIRKSQEAISGCGLIELFRKFFSANWVVEFCKIEVYELDIVNYQRLAT